MFDIFIRLYESRESSETKKCYDWSENYPKIESK